MEISKSFPKSLVLSRPSLPAKWFNLLFIDPGLSLGAFMYV